MFEEPKFENSKDLQEEGLLKEVIEESPEEKPSQKDEESALRKMAKIGTMLLALWGGEKAIDKALDIPQAAAEAQEPMLAESLQEQIKDFTIVDADKYIVVDTRQEGDEYAYIVPSNFDVLSNLEEELQKLKERPVRRSRFTSAKTFNRIVNKAAKERVLRSLATGIKKSAEIKVDIRKFMDPPPEAAFNYTIGKMEYKESELKTLNQRRKEAVEKIAKKLIEKQEKEKNK